MATLTKLKLKKVNYEKNVEGLQTRIKHSENHRRYLEDRLVKSNETITARRESENKLKRLIYTH